MSSKRPPIARSMLGALLLGVLLALMPGPVTAQDEVGINFIAFDCPNLETDPYSGCDFPNSATFEILADGVPLAGSPFTTGPTGLLPGFFFSAPAGATLTITEQSVDPPGNAPAPGFDPLVVNVDDIPIGGCGGESTCPTIEFINLPFAIADGPAGEPPVAPADEISTLPATGSGPNGGNLQPPLFFWITLVLGAICAAGALAARPAPSRARCRR